MDKFGHKQVHLFSVDCFGEKYLNEAAWLVNKKLLDRWTK